MTSTRWWSSVCGCSCQLDHGSGFTARHTDAGPRQYTDAGPRQYCTLMPRRETELESIDGLLLRAIGSCLRITANRFRTLLNMALRNSVRTDCALTSIFTSSCVGGGKGQKSRTLYFTPDSPDVCADCPSAWTASFVAWEAPGFRRGMASYCHCLEPSLLA